jgi:hypothetical protein
MPQVMRPGPRRRPALASLLIPVALGACGLEGRAEPAAARRAAVVYGVDDRVEPFEHPDPSLRRLAENAVAMLVDAASLDERDPAAVRVVGAGTLGEARGLCPGERFFDQPEPGQCSGTLIGSRLLLTAGHCVSEPGDCSASRPWVFGYRYEAPGRLAPLTAGDVYRCARIVALRETATADFAVIELDRDVVGRVPAPIATAPGGGAARPRAGDAVALIGHPNGIPMKIASGGVVLSASATSARASLDAFEGNSGSGVFDTAGRLVALLDSGADDYVWTGSCFTVDVLDPAEAEGEGLTLAGPAIEAACRALGGASPLCACATPPCDAAGTPDAGGPVDGGAMGPPLSRSGGAEGCACAAAGRRGVAAAPSLALGASMTGLAWLCRRCRRRRPDRRYSRAWRSTS